MRMDRTQLWLLASLAFASVTLVDGSPLKVMTSPNLLRVGAPENIFVECQDCTGGNIPVTINIKNHPTKTQTLKSTSVTLTSQNHFQAFGEIKIPAGEFSRDPSIKQYVYVEAVFPDRVLEKVVLVSFQSGYIFIQTDKGIYTPNSNVLYRLFTVTPRMEPVESEGDANNATSIYIEIVTPDNIILAGELVSPTSGIHSGYFTLRDNISPGVWKLVARFHSSPQESYTAEFEVKEYVLPSFEVKLSPESSFFYVDSPELIVNIGAKYLFGERVDGTAFVVFGVVADNQKKSFPSSLQRLPVDSGKSVARLKREHITRTYPNMDELVGKSIFIAVSVLTQSGSEMVEAELRGIHIVKSPYTIHFKKTPKYFKPGMSFEVTVEVVDPNGTPAQGVAVVVEPGAVRGLTAANGIMRLPINTVSNADRLSISAKTDDHRISPETQATATMQALPYKSISNNFIHIGVSTAELKLGENLRVDLLLNRQINHDTDITFLIMSRGQLVGHNRYRTRGQVLISRVIPITKDMLPSFRIIAYFHPSDNEVVSDSVWIDVTDTCMGTLKLEPSAPLAAYMPHKIFGLKITGDPGARGGLVAVDKGVYVLNNKHHISQKKVWDVIEKYDTGCTPGGGKDSMNVFYDAGLMFESSTASGTPDRQEKKCPAPSKRRRRVTTTLTEEDDEYYLESQDIFSRSSFHESWLWTDLNLPSCPPHSSMCDSMSETRSVSLPDSITTWVLTGISLSRTHGLCVSEPLEVIVQKEFFIDLRLPSSAVRGEQIEVKAILHNYTPDPVTVRVELIEGLHMCSAASKRAKYRQEVQVGAHTTQSVPFVMIPIREGRHTIEVKAAVKDSWLNDGVQKVLHVVPEGVLSISKKIIILDPMGGKQQEIVNSEIPRTDLVPNTHTSTQIAVTGNAQEPGLHVVIQLPGRANPERFLFNRENSYTTRTLRMNDINQDVEVTAEGSGQVTLTMLSLYYAKREEPVNDCQKFNLSVQLLPVNLADDNPIYKLKIEMSYKDRDHDASMSILDIGLLPGFTVNTDDLDLMLRGPARTISKYEMNHVLSDRGSLIIYLDKVSHTRPEEITFRLHQTMKVGVLQPAAVSVYEYYDSNPCITFYHPQRRAGQLLRLCRDQVCTCAEENCSMQKKGAIPNNLRIDKSCESTPTSKIDLVFKVRVEHFRIDPSADIYMMRVLNVIKGAGSQGGNAEGKLHTFLSFRHCRESLDIGTSKTYLIMGTSSDVHGDDVQQTYLLGERTWIEYWPTEQECLTPEYRPICLGLQELVDQHMRFGCPL